MRMIEDRADARLLPSRFHFAIFRLAAFALMRTSRPRPQSGLLLIIDRDQSAFEHYAVSLWILFTSGMWTAAALEQVMPRFLALVLALPLATVLLHFCFGFSTLVFLLGRSVVKSESRIARHFNAAVMMTLLIAAAALAAATRSWARFAGVAFLAVVAANAAAAVVMFLLRARVREMEARCGL